MPTRNPHDEEDLEMTLRRNTADGPGFEDESELPESDFISFATEGVEEDDK